MLNCIVTSHQLYVKSLLCFFVTVCNAVHDDPLTNMNEHFHSSIVYTFPVLNNAFSTVFPRKICNKAENIEAIKITKIAQITAIVCFDL